MIKNPHGYYIRVSWTFKITMEVLIILSLCLFSGAMSQSMCTQDNYERCIQGITPYIRESLLSFFPNFSISALPSLCQQYDFTKMCFKGFQDDCPDGDRASLLSLQARFDYLCTEKRQGFITHRTCLNSPELKPRGEFCNSTFVGGLSTDQVGSICGYLKAFQDCVYAEVWRTCGKEAADWLKGHLKAFQDCVYAEVWRTCGREAADWLKGYEQSHLEPTVRPIGCRLDITPHAYCTGNTITNCTQPLRKYGLHDGWEDFSNFSVSVVRDICGTYNNVKPCIDTFIDNCDTSTRVDFQVIHDTFTYICVDNFMDYTRHSTCLQTPALIIQGQLCTESFQMALNSPFYVATSDERREILFCRYTHILLECLENFVTTHCGPEAAAWQRGFNAAQIEETLKLRNCSISDGKPPTTVIPQPGVPASNCSLSKFVECVTPLARYTLGFDQNAAGFPISYLEDICNVYVSRKPCFDMGARACPNITQYETLRKTFSYICEDHLSDYKQYGSCLQRPDLHNEVQNCSQTFINNRDLDVDGLPRNTTCQEVKSLEDCIYAAVEPICGPEAASLNRGFDKMLMKTLFSHLNLTCNMELSKGVTGTGVTIFSMFSSALLLFSARVISLAWI